MTSITRYSLERILVDDGIPLESILLLKEEFGLPSKDWIENILPLEFTRFLEYLGCTDYDNDDNVCQNFAEYCKTFASARHHATDSLEKPKGGVTVGVFIYYPANVRGIEHSINIIIRRSIEENRYYIIYWDPQTKSPRDVSNEEKLTCKHCFFS